MTKFHAPTLLATAALAALAFPALAGKPGGGATTGGAGPKEISACQTITEPGSYVLMQNVEETLGGNCLEVDAPNVTIDLNGFTIKGTGAGYAVRAWEVGEEYTTVRNGTIDGFESGVAVRAGVVEHLTIINVAYGVQVAFQGVARNNYISAQTAGIFAGGGVIENNQVWSLNFGIYCNYACTVRANSVAGTYGDGGIHAYAGAVVANNAVSGFKVGIDVICPTLIQNNSAINADQWEIKRTLTANYANAPCVMTDNVAPKIQ
jgi:hypothetical protein